MASKNRKSEKLTKWLPKDQYFAKRRAEYAKKSYHFLNSDQWKELRKQVFERYGRKCMKCGVTPSSGAIMQVDHIKPRSKFPELMWDLNNLQVLCRECNREKSNINSKNYKIAAEMEGLDWSGTSRS